METKESTHIIKLTSEEAYDIACDIKYSLITTAKTHWVNHPEVWRKNEEIRLKRLKYFYGLSNYADHYEYAVSEVEEILKKHLEEKSKTVKK